MAHAFFLDSFLLYSVSSSTNVKTGIAITESGIVDSFTKKHQFHNSAHPEKQWLDMGHNEHYMIWAQMETLRNFAKIWGVIQGDMPAGKYSVTITNKFDTEIIDGAKYLYFSSVNIFGGGNKLLGIIFFIAFGISCATLVSILVLHYVFKLDTKKLVDSKIEDLVW